jgi:predicted secreted protein
VFNLSRSLLLVVSLVIPSWIQAGEAAVLNFIGFSQNGQYLAFEQFGTYDGQGGHFSHTYVVDVAKNKYAIKPQLHENIEGNITLLEFKNNLTSLQQTFIEPYQIIAENRGQQVIGRLFTDMGADRAKVQFSLQPPLVPLVQNTYTVILEEINAASEADCFGFGEAKRFRLKIIHDQTQTSQVLQADRKLPTTRGCALGYRIQDVYIYDNQWVSVFINMFTLGFEGQSMRYLVVTGRLPIPADERDAVKG